MTITEEFKNYIARCYSPAPSPDQHRQLEQAFFAGALVTFTVMRKISNLPMESGVKSLGTLEQEIIDRCMVMANEAVAKATQPKPPDADHWKN